MKQPQRNASGRYTQSWTEHDEAVFLDLLKRKISELRWEIKSSDSPYVRARLRARRKEYEGRIGEVYEILRKGSETARATAAETLREVRRAMKIDYFEDRELIEEQARHYARKAE